MINFGWYDIWKDSLEEYIDKQGYTLDPWWTAMYEKCLKSVLLLNIFGFMPEKEMQRIHRAICVRIMLEAKEK